MQPIEEGKESKKKEVSLSLLVLLRKECMIMTQQAYAVAYFLRWRCTALCDGKTAVLPGDGEQAHYKFFFA